VVCEANGELGITTSSYYIEDDKLQAHFMLRLSSSLKLSYDAHNTHLDLDKMTDLDTWIEHIHLLDMELEAKCAEWLKIAMETYQSAWHPA
jgi:hypothetical protein